MISYTTPNFEPSTSFSSLTPQNRHCTILELRFFLRYEGLYLPLTILPLAFYQPHLLLFRVVL